MLGQVDAALAATERWLSLGRDVLVRGGDGSGKSSFLEVLQDRWARRGLSCLVVRGSYAVTLGPLGPLHVQDAAAVGRAGRVASPGGGDLAASLAEELGASGGLVLLDDLDLVDAATVGVLERILRRTSALLVATTRSDPGSVPASVRQFVAERAPADVPLEPLGHRATSELLNGLLGAPAEAAIIAAVATRSGGNPRAAVALVDAARFAGVLRRDDDIWTVAGSFDEVPLSPIVNGLCTSLDPGDVDALELLAWAGPLPLGEAERLLGEQRMTRLVARDRVVTLTTDAGVVASVSPPALAHGLRRRLTDTRRLVLAERATAAFGADFVPANSFGSTPDAAQELAFERERTGGWNADLAQLIADHSAVQEAVRRSVWRRDPSATNAVLLLRSVKRQLSRAQISEVFQLTTVSPDDSPEVQAELQMHQAIWAYGHGDSVEEVEAVLALGRDPAGKGRPLSDLLAAILAGDLHRVREEVDLAWREHERADEPFITRMLALFTAHTLIEETRFAEALALVDPILQAVASGATIPYLQGARTEALLGLGRIEEATLWAAGCLDVARDELDPVGVRIHAVGLAEALYFAGDQMGAWEAVASALSLEPSGPFDGGYHRRLFALASILQTLTGDLSLASVLHQEASRTERTVHTPLDSVVAISGAAYVGATGETEAAGTALWVAGGRCAERGLLASAALCWALRGQPYSTAQLDRVTTALAGASIPLLAPYLRLHEAITSGNEEAILAALGACTPSCAPTLALSALTAIDAARDQKGAEPLTAPERESLVGSALRTRLTNGVDPTGSDELSERERQVALLAREGLSNRQIADRLYLSVRTVENHMYRALRKLGMSGRGDLRSWLP